MDVGVFYCAGLFFPTHPLPAGSFNPSCPVIDTDPPSLYLEKIFLRLEGTVSSHREISLCVILSITSIIFLFFLNLVFPDKHSSYGSGKNLILITIDTLSADKLSCYGSLVATPFIDSLAAAGTVFGRAYSQVPITLPSHATIMTGTYPYSHGIRHNGKFRLNEDASTLAELLKIRGYHTAAFIGAYVLDSKYGLSQGFDLYDDELPAPMYSSSGMYTARRASEVTDSALEWLGKTDEPFFIWVHYFDPHSPYDPPEPFCDLYEHPYDGEVAYVDSEVGRLLGAVSSMGLGQRTMITLTADHGESLGEHGEKTHAIFVYSSTTHVPLMMTLPGSIPPGSRDTTVVQLVDVMPTLLSALGVATPPGCEGMDLFYKSASDEQIAEGYAYSETWAPRLQYGWSELKSLRNSKYLYVKAPLPEFYDLSIDNGETTNIYGESPAGLLYFEAALDSIARSAEETAKNVQMELEAADREALESLGYVFHNFSRDSMLEDPKDMIGIHGEILKGMKLLGNGSYSSALEILTRVLAVDEDDPSIYLAVGFCYDGLGEYAEALSFFKHAIELDPLEERSYYAAANVLARMEMFEESIAIVEALASIYPEDPVVRLRLARALSMSGESDQAYLSYLKAVELGDDDYRTHLGLGRFLTLRGRYSEALSELGQVLELEPGSAEAHALKGASFARLGDLEKAANSFRSSLKSDRTSVSSWVDLGRVLIELGDNAGARDALEEALFLDPGNGAAEKALAQLDNREGAV